MIFAAMVVIGIILYLIDIFYYRKRQPASDSSDDTDKKIPAANSSDGIGSAPESTAPEAEDAGNAQCCGMHMVCEKTNLSPVTGEIVYYDDEELDRFRGREPESYTLEETEEFRDVLMTLLPQDVAGWSRSIQVRGIQLPTDVRDELLMIVAELRHSGN